MKVGELIFLVRSDAELVLKNLNLLITQNGGVTVGELYQMCAISSLSYEDELWGWLDTKTTTITQVSTGYSLNLPEPKPIKIEE